MKNLLFLITLLILCSCASRKQIEYRDRYVDRYITTIQHDTIINNTRDSVFVSIYEKGDTIYNTKYVEKTIYVDKIKIQVDTIYRDSIRTEIVEKTKEITKIPKIYSISLVICIIMLIFAIAKALKWLKIF